MWFATFFECALVNRVNRLFIIRMVIFITQDVSSIGTNTRLNNNRCQITRTVRLSSGAAVRCSNWLDRDSVQLHFSVFPEDEREAHRSVAVR